METKQSFFTVQHYLDTQVELTEDFEVVDTPRAFKDIELYPHQQTVVKALIDIEDRRVVTVNSGDYLDLGKGEIKIETSGVVLSEPFGTGKTIEILGWILERPIPKAMPTHVNSIVLKINEDRPRRGYNTGVPKMPFKHEIVRRFIGPDALIRPNLIVVGSSVLVQWENAVKSFTNLRVFSIGNYHQLQTFYKMYKEKTLKAFDVILLKNGVVTGNFTLPGEASGDEKSYRSLLSVISLITAENCWSRVIYDDFDTIKIPPGSRAINALFSAYVSATTKEAPNVKSPVIKYKTLEDAIASKGAASLNLVLRDRSLFTNFNIRNTKNFVEASTKIPTIKKFKYVYANPDDNYIRLLGAMGEQDANNIMEMLNGDAIGTAAAEMGIKTSSVADIFKRMLDKKYEKYMNDKYVLETIEKARGEVDSLEPHPENKRHTLTDLDSFKSSIAKKTVPNFKFYSVELDRLLDEMDVEYRESMEQNGLAINRVIDNIKEQQCQVCCLPLESMDAFIVRCCGLIVCDVCGIKGNQIGKRYDYKLKANTICGSCANCKATVYPQTDLIFVDRNFDMEALLKAKGDEEPAAAIEEAPAETPEAAPDTPAEPQIKNPKLKALRSIILTGTAEGAEVSDAKITHLLEGRIDIPQPADIDRKVLVFANFNETLNMVENFLVEQNIPFLRLGGTYRENAETVKKFKTYGKVLLINSQQHCAGINAQFASDLCYFHKITDSNIESQVCGRIQRIGRTCNAHVHYLAYNNEKDMV